jgi:hypothetical protein
MSRLFKVILLSFIAMIYTAVTIPGLLGYGENPSSMFTVYLVTFCFSLVVFCLSSIVGIFRLVKGIFRSNDPEDENF